MNREYIIRDMNNYELYKNKEFDKLKENVAIMYGRYDNRLYNSYIASLDSLSVLEELGFPMNHKGTYLLADEINIIRSRIDQYELLYNMTSSKYEYLRDMYQQTNSASSNIYVNVNKINKNDINKTHCIIEDAIDKIDLDNVDFNVFFELFEKNNEELTHGKIAILIASYLDDNYKYDQESYSVETKIKIKKLGALTDKRILNNVYIKNKEN